MRACLAVLIVAGSVAAFAAPPATNEASPEVNKPDSATSGAPQVKRRGGEKPGEPRERAKDDCCAQAAVRLRNECIQRDADIERRLESRVRTLESQLSRMQSEIDRLRADQMRPFR